MSDSEEDYDEGAPQEGNDEMEEGGDDFLTSFRSALDQLRTKDRSFFFNI